jgi:hypothetical protein
LNLTVLPSSNHHPALRWKGIIMPLIIMMMVLTLRFIMLP